MIRRDRRRDRGYSLFDAVLILLTMASLVLAAAPLFLEAARAVTARADAAPIVELGVGRMNELRSTPYDALAPGGSLEQDLPSYFLRDDGYVVRWRITERATPVGSKTVEVRVLSERAPFPALPLDLATVVVP